MLGRSITSGNPGTRARHHRAIYGMIGTQRENRSSDRDLASRIRLARLIGWWFFFFLLHLWMYCDDLSPCESDAKLSQALFDQFCGTTWMPMCEKWGSAISPSEGMQAFGGGVYGRAGVRIWPWSRQRGARAGALQKS